MEGAPQPPSTNEPELDRALPEQFQLTPWPDEVVEAMGYGPRTMYVEMCWLPVLGPTATWLYRRLGSWAEFNPDGTSVDTIDLSQSLGLGEGLSRNSLIGRAIGRLIRFEAARWIGEELQVRRALAPLPQRHLKRLGRTSRRLHDEITRRPQTIFKRDASSGTEGQR